MKYLLLRIYYYFRKVFCRKHNYFIYKYTTDPTIQGQLANGFDSSCIINGHYKGNKVLVSLLSDVSVLFVVGLDDVIKPDISGNLLNVLKNNCLYDLKVAELMKCTFNEQAKKNDVYAIYNLSDKIDSKFLFTPKKLNSITHKLNTLIGKILPKKLKVSKPLVEDITKLKDLVEKEDYTTLIPEGSARSLIDKLGLDVATSQIAVDYNQIDLKNIDYPIGNFNDIDYELRDLIDNRQPLMLAVLIWVVAILHLYDSEHFSYFLNLPFVSLEGLELKKEIVSKIDLNNLKQESFNLTDGLLFSQPIQRQHPTPKDILLMIDKIRNYYVNKFIGEKCSS